MANRFISFGFFFSFWAITGGASAQYPGQLAPGEKKPVLRSVAVLEWTGDAANKPKASRLVPLTIFNGEELVDGGLYLARPEPLSVAPGVEYELEEGGKVTGLYDVDHAGQEQGGWVGYGNWKRPPAPPKPTKKIEKIDDWNDPDDRPILHRKHHPEDRKSASDADRPTLHKKSDAGATKAQSEDGDRPTLHKRSEDDAEETASAPDPDRPVLRKPRTSGDPQSKKKKKEKDVGFVDALATGDDPDRPRLKRGKPVEAGVAVLPSLMGMPPDLRQTVAVSDAAAGREHRWRYEWTDAAEEARMRGLLEDKARAALGLNVVVPAPAPSVKKIRTKNGAKAAKPVVPPTPPEPALLADAQFRAFELAYGAGATLVYSAHTEPGEDGAPVKFVTLVAQPDLYGNLVVLLTNVTDAAHLDVTPRLRLIDAVDAEADHRGELVFELRGASARQFALYRVLRGQAERRFVTAPMEGSREQ